MDAIGDDPRIMYQLPEPPPEMELNEYIVQYRQTGDEKYLAYFLHSYERKLNAFVTRVCKKYRQEHRFVDVKLAIVEALVTKLPQYDPMKGAAFLTFAAPYVRDTIHGLIRQCGGVFSARPREYRTMKKVLAIYNKYKNESRAEWLRAIWLQTGLSDDDIIDYIRMGEQFRFPIDNDSTENEDGERADNLVRVPDIYSDPEYLVLRGMRYDDMVDEIEKLRDRDSRLVLDYLGIDCLYCGRASAPKPIADIADELQLRDEQSVKRRFDKVVDGLRAEMEKRGWITT